jgi:HEAT repeat protein
VVGPDADKALAPLANLARTTPNQKIRDKAIVALLSIHGLYRLRDSPAKAVPNLITSLESRDPETRWQAATILGVLGATAKDAAPALTKASQDKDARVRQAATGALERVK